MGSEGSDAEWEEKQQALQQSLEQNEKLMGEMQLSWQDRLHRTEQLAHEREEALQVCHCCKPCCTDAACCCELP